MKLPSYNVEFLPLERRLCERRHAVNMLRALRSERRRTERRLLPESGDNVTQFTRS